MVSVVAPSLPMRWFYPVLIFLLVCQDVDRSTVPGSNGMRMAVVCWLYFASKFTEFADTFFFIARKKFAHVSVLQVGLGYVLAELIGIARCQAFFIRYEYLAVNAR